MAEGVKRCKGEGEIIVEMQFLADVHLTCERMWWQTFWKNSGSAV